MAQRCRSRGLNGLKRLVLQPRNWPLRGRDTRSGLAADASRNWWLLTSHVRPSAVDTRYWTWQNVRTYPWLRQHNFRGAGDGMAWPDLTLVPEGAVTRIVWSQDYRRHLAPIRFASDGSYIVRA